MTLILTALTKNHILIAADQRTIATHNVTGEVSVLTDDAEKLIIGPDIVVTLVGGSDLKTHDPAARIRDWLETGYDAREPFQSQIKLLYDNYFASGNNGGFIAACYRDGICESYRFTGSGKPTYECQDDPAKVSLKFNGSSNEIARELIDELRPPIATYNIHQLGELMRTLIASTHDVMVERGETRVSVGRTAMVAMIDAAGARLLSDADLTVDKQKS